MFTSTVLNIVILILAGFAICLSLPGENICKVMNCFTVVVIVIALLVVCLSVGHRSVSQLSTVAINDSLAGTLSREVKFRQEVTSRSLLP
jgi:hypothetical protein